MKRLPKYCIIILLIFATVLLSMATYVKLALPNIAIPSDLKVNITPERVAKGKYMANHVAVCMDCHSTRDWSYFSGPITQNNLGGGGEKFGRAVGFPGDFYAPNITPYALKNWTDGELFRAITSGVNKEGKALFPVMPYHSYGKMDKEDIYDIIAYIRTLDPVSHKSPQSQADFPVSLLINTMPENPAFEQRPLPDDKLKYGKYLVNMAGCKDCHSQADKGKIVEGTEFGGGREFNQPGGIVRSSNITRDIETGMGGWTLASFSESFKKYRDTGYTVPLLEKGDLNSSMPWTMYAGMKDEDLEAIYIYLNSINPISNKVVRYEKKAAL